MLCSACQRIFRGRLIFDDRGFSEHENHHKTAQSFAHAISQKCYICTSMLQQYQADRRGTLEPLQLAEVLTVTEYYFTKLKAKDDDSPLRLWVRSSESPRDERITCTFKLAEAESSEKTCQFAPNTASESCWKLAKRWLSSCRIDHTRCTKFLSATPFHPTRLIEIAPLASASNDKLHLRIAGEHSPEVPYMTLSHCWGKSEFLKLTKTTFQRLRDGFSAAETLSKTFQDAIIICRELGVKHLWIDSLCIFQDSPEDWRCEAAQMGQVYENSLCIIAATGASNAEEGCFKDRDGSLLRRCIIKSESNNQTNGTWEIIDEEFWDARIDRSPLNKRGWVMQERWLSPRVLHYGRDQILWECGELDACETYPGGLPKSLRNARSGFKLDPDFERKIAQQDGYTYTKPDLESLNRSTWSSMIDKYSVTSLTKGEDKLVAISGIAKRMQSLLDDEYLAGLWRKNLPCQLLWRVNNHDPAYFLAPTRPRP